MEYAENPPGKGGNHWSKLPSRLAWHGIQYSNRQHRTCLMSGHLPSTTDGPMDGDDIEPGQTLSKQTSGKMLDSMAASMHLPGRDVSSPLLVTAPPLPGLAF